MALLAKEPEPAPLARAWRAALGSLVATAVFLLVLSLSAWCTRDSAGAVPHEAPIDAGATGALDRGADSALERGARAADAGGPETDADGAGAAAAADAGAQPDAGEIVTVPGDVDAGPPEVPGPPVAPADVSAAVAPVLEACLAAALRFDPSIGGVVRARFVVEGRTVKVEWQGAVSPVLAACVAERQATIALTTDAPAVIAARVRFDGLRRTVAVDELSLER